MWDAIKRAAQHVADWGEGMVRHGNAVERILGMPSEQQALVALREHVFNLENDTEFGRFLQAVTHMHALAQQSANQAEGAWGNSFEDRIAYGMAHIEAGRTSPAAIARQRVHYLAIIYQLAGGFWAEAQQNRAVVPDPARPAG